jgi:hypothetical protein
LIDLFHLLLNRSLTTASDRDSDGPTSDFAGLTMLTGVPVVFLGAVPLPARDRAR